MNDKLGRPRILIVDDVPANIDVLWRALKAEYKVSFARNGEDALRFAASGSPPHLILLDIMMQDMDGYEVCRRLKAGKETQNIPVIFITAKSRDEDETMGFELGAVDYIRKPFSIATVKVRVRTHLELEKHRYHLEELVRLRTAELTTTNEQLRLEIAARKRAEDALRKAHDELERRVEERTSELLEANMLLKLEIAERKRAEKALQESEEKYRLVVENAHEAIVVAQEGRHRFFNAKTSEITGYAAEEFTEKELHEIIHPNDREAVLSHQRKILKGNGRPAGRPFRIIDKNGREKWIEMNVVRIDWKGRTATLNFLTDITDRKRSEEALKEKEEYLRTIMATIQTGVIIIDAKTHTILDANPYASGMIGCRVEDLIGRDYRRYTYFERLEASSPVTEAHRSVDFADCVLRTVNEEMVNVRRSFAPVKIRDQEYLVQSFLDITDIKQLLKKQEINIGLAKGILNLINGVPPRYSKLTQDLELFADAISVPCHAEGGDHFFVANLPANGQGGRGKTVISLKDQSGHEVSCVLRSIITDLIHNAILNNDSSIFLEEAIATLNNEICHSLLFKQEDFFTSINAEIDHETLTLRYVSTGHPPFLLIRGKEVMSFPGPGEEGANVPIGVSGGIRYSAGKCRLGEGDKLLFYTDGLNEMPQRNCDRVMTFQEMKDLVEEIVQRSGAMPVSDLSRKILRVISERSREEVVPFLRNTSGDDVTLLCLEIENLDAYHETVIRPRDSGEMGRVIAALYEEIKVEWDRQGYENPEPRLRIILEEAALNAWKHGNKLDPDKAVTFRRRYGNDFHLEVIDEGEGFDHGCLPDPTSEKNIAKPSGRGIFIIRHYASLVCWKEGGRHLVASFRKKPGPEEEKHREQTGRLMKLWKNTREYS